MRTTLRLTALGLLLAGLTIPATATAVAEECQGKPATIVVPPGTESADGTAGDDVILVLADDASTFSGSGDDTICVAVGGGAVFGGSGHDSVEARGTAADDELYVQQVEDLDIDLTGGDDILRLRSIVDGTGSVDLGGGQDELLVFQLRGVVADLQRDRLVLDGSGRYDLLGAESLFAAARNTILVGDQSAQRLAAAGNACTIAMRGGGGADRLTVAAGESKDYNCQRYVRRLLGEQGDDVLKGRDRADVLLGGPGRDAAYGGGGRDRCVAETKRSCET